MKLVADSGLWTTGSISVPAPLTAILEVSGAVLSWTIDEPPEAAAMHISFTDVDRADWLWRLVGEAGHSAVAAAVSGRHPDDARQVDVAGFELPRGPVEPLRRLAVGHWLRRWWPASHRDGIAALNRAVLDAEVALLTNTAQDFFTDDTLDSDIDALISPHAVALRAIAAAGDPRVGELVRSCFELADDLNTGWDTGGPESPAPVAYSAGHRDDYALAAGDGSGSTRQGTIASGTASINWAAVPPGIFDAAENTLDWSIEAGGADVVAAVRTEKASAAPATGIAVRLRSSSIGGIGTLAADGTTRLSLVDDAQAPITESVAWDHDWSGTSVVIGAEVSESPEIRDRIRRFVRDRLDGPAGDAFLAEILAAESDY
jgi:hypothetical protein